MSRTRHPGALVVAAFGAAIAGGATLLSLPVAHAGSADVSIGDSLFTAASAVTVTGLTVVDTSADWSTFGETVLIVLMQIGGLGIMTLAGFLGLALSRRMGIRAGLLAGAEMGLADLGALRGLVRNIVLFVLASEALVAVLLTARFWTDDAHTLRGAIHLGVFHSISAFNNAGFSNLEGGLGVFAGDWYFNLVTAGAFIVGGLGFPVVFELRRRWREPRSWSLHTKVTLAVTASLLVIGTVLVLIVEWTNADTIGASSVPTKVLASFFQSATARTAGFNTLPTEALRSGTWLVMILLMVIGAGSASTGGGIKASTFALVVKATIAEFRQDKDVVMFDRHISRDLQAQALALVVAALGTVGSATFVLAVLLPDLDVAELLFEATSAFGTVGLSTGITGDLGAMGKVVVVVLMFIGRVGPLTFGTAVLLRRQARKYAHAEEGLIVG